MRKRSHHVDGKCALILVTEKEKLFKPATINFFFVSIGLQRIIRVKDGKAKRKFSFFRQRWKGWKRKKKVL